MDDGRFVAAADRPPDARLRVGSAIEAALRATIGKADLGAASNRRLREDWLTTSTGRRLVRQPQWRRRERQ